MIKITTEEDLRRFNTSDVELLDISWIENGRDMEFSFKRNDSVKCSFICTWASNLLTAIKTNPDEGGYLMSGDISFITKENDELDVEFNFGSKGQIFLRCKDLIYNDVI